MSEAASGIFAKISYPQPPLRAGHAASGWVLRVLGTSVPRLDDGIFVKINYPQDVLKAGRRQHHWLMAGPPPTQRKLTHEGRKFRPSPHLGSAKTEEGVMR
jgi:hypothetical protein